MTDATVLVVTDPMCSWCWGMSAAVEEAAHQFSGEVAFDVLMGGINVHGTQPIGEFGRRHLKRIWEEVHEVTGQPFGFRLPEGIVYNSTLPCMAVEAIRRRTGSAPFGFLHRLQQALFVHGEDISEVATLSRIAQEFGWQRGELREELEDGALGAAVRAQFESSREYGTNALPSLLIEDAAGRALLLGGYADSTTIVETTRARLAARAERR